MPSASPDLSREQLLEQIPIMIENSPVLSRNEGEKQQLLKIATSLTDPQLKELYELLQKEETDWRKILPQMEQEQQQLIERAKTETLQVQKEAEKVVKEAQKKLSEKEKQEAAELLKQFDE